jgi:hypothetical protein
VKAKTYISWGSQCIWIIDPEKRNAWSLSREGATEPAWVSPDGVLQSGQTAIELPALFEEVGGKLEMSEEEDSFTDFIAEFATRTATLPRHQFAC